MGDFVDLIPVFSDPTWVLLFKPYFMVYQSGINSSYVQCDQHYKINNGCKLTLTESDEEIITTFIHQEDVSILLIYR